MKNLLLGFAACALILTSCSKQEITETALDGQGLLSFSPGLGKQSPSGKASEMTNILLEGSAIDATTGIALRTYQETTTAGTYKHWFTDDLWYTNTKWQISSTRFRNTAKTKYIAYFPKSTKLEEVKDAGDNSKTTFETATFAAGGKFPAFTYTVGATSAVDDQEDLLAGITEIAANKSDIVLGMRHILSQVNFGTVAYNGANIAIRNIKIEGLFNNATYEYKAANVYPIGEWGTNLPVARDISYKYFNYSNTDDAIDFNPQPVVKHNANSEDIYVFGDGGKWGAGQGAKVFYPAKADGTWAVYNTQTPPAALNNSLMLMPQSFVGVNTAKVTFEFQITDKNDAFIAGGPALTTWEKGEFKLNFATGADQGEDYMAEWHQNYRYVYLIDFTDFLNGNALTFTVDVDMYPWENYDGGSGGVDIVVAGQPTQVNMNSIATTERWYIATQAKAPAPTVADWAQVIRHETWDMSAYDFKLIAKDGTFDLNFQNVIFNTSATLPAATTINLTLPDGFSAVAKTDKITVAPHATLSNTWVVSAGDRSVDAAVTITNDSYYRTAVLLKAAIEATTVADKMKFGYGGTDAIDLTTMIPTQLGVNEIITVRFNSLVVPKVDGNWTWNSSTQTATYTEPVAVP